MKVSMTSGSRTSASPILRMPLTDAAADVYGCVLAPRLSVGNAASGVRALYVCVQMRIVTAKAVMRRL